MFILVSLYCNHMTGTSGNNVRSSKSILCFRCGETGHMRRHCPKAKSGGGSHSAKNHFESGRLTCFFCDGEGHRKVDCPERKAWLAKKSVNTAATGSAKIHAFAPLRFRDSCHELILT